MVLFTRFVGRRVRDSAGRHARLVDVAVDLRSGEYPHVCGLLLHTADGCVRELAPWPGLPAQGDILVTSLDAARPLDPAAGARRVLLGRDILDALVLDLVGLRAVRANDLWLRAADGLYLLAGADVSPWAVLRRLSRGLLGDTAPSDILDWQHIEFLRGAPATVDARDYHCVVATLPAPQIADLAAALPYPHAAELLALLPEGLAAKVLERMAPERQTQVVTSLAEAQAAAILAAMAPELAADVLGQLAAADAARLLQRLPPAASRQLQDLLQYSPDTAGGIMTNLMVTALVDSTVAEVLEQIRPQLPAPDFVHYVYLLDDAERRRLRGVVTLRDLIVATGDTPVARVMTPEPFAVPPDCPALRVAEQLLEHDLNAVPVVTAAGRLVGVVTIDAALALLAPATWRDQVPRIFS